MKIKWKITEIFLKNWYFKNRFCKHVAPDILNNRVVAAALLLSSKIYSSIYLVLDPPPRKCANVQNIPLC
jgi:hypothetical protein